MHFKPKMAFMRSAKSKMPAPPEVEPEKMSKGGEVCEACGGEIEKWADGGEVGSENERIRVRNADTEPEEDEGKRQLFRKMMSKRGGN